MCIVCLHGTIHLYGTIVSRNDHLLSPHHRALPHTQRHTYMREAHMWVVCTYVYAVLHVWGHMSMHVHVRADA